MTTPDRADEPNNAPDQTGDRRVATKRAGGQRLAAPMVIWLALGAVIVAAVLLMALT